MLDTTTLKPIFAEKLLATGSMDAALLKVIWLAYKHGLADANFTIEPIQVGLPQGSQPAPTRLEEELLIATDPRRWDAYHQQAWHRNIPDLAKAFAALQAVALAKSEGREPDPAPYEANWDEARVDIVGQNGNDGLHYSSGGISAAEYFENSRAMLEDIHGSLTDATVYGLGVYKVKAEGLYPGPIHGSKPLSFSRIDVRQFGRGSEHQPSSTDGSEPEPGHHEK